MYLDLEHGCHYLSKKKLRRKENWKEPPRAHTAKAESGVAFFRQYCKHKVVIDQCIPSCTCMIAGAVNVISIVRYLSLKVRFMILNPFHASPTTFYPSDLTDLA